MADIPLHYASTAPPPAWARVLLRPLGWPFYFAQILLFIVIFCTAILPGNVFTDIIAFIFGSLLAFIYFLRFALRLVLWAIYKHPWPRFWQTSRPFILALIAPVLLAILLLLDVPFLLAFLCNKSALEREATAAKAAYPSTLTPSSIGLFPIRSIAYDPSEDTVKIIIDGAGFIEEQGVAFSNRPLPPRAGAEIYEPISGPWYHYTLLHPAR